ncbi:hypothetical protein RRG08_061731 [Elysia crispata]|uniref:Uncharacterized protein n=1 Tax=Elysia crispata TaxID=231223 RepID=A0AAE1A8Q4_9GAST|nr:hypothetical protein RRG08_061731 [Elysia crispata]
MSKSTNTSEGPGERGEASHAQHDNSAVLPGPVNPRAHARLPSGLPISPTITPCSSSHLQHRTREIKPESKRGLKMVRERGRIGQASFSISLELWKDLLQRLAAFRLLREGTGN